MIRGVGALLMVFACHAVLAGFGPPCNTNVTVEYGYARITAIARCAWTTMGVQDNSVSISCEHTLEPGSKRDTCSGAGYASSTLQIMPFSASTTYTSTATFKASQVMIPFDEITVSDSETTDPPLRPRDDWGEDCTGESCGESPIVIDLERGAYRLTNVADGVMFDIDADGTAERVAWTRDASVAFLFLDRNGNGLPDDGSELFGNHTRLRSGRKATHGFEALAELDANGDGAVTSNDPRWSELRLWRDADHDGRAAAREIGALTEIRALEVTPQWTGRRDASGNTLRWKATALLARGEQRPFYDVYLVTVR